MAPPQRIEIFTHQFYASGICLSGPSPPFVCILAVPLLSWAHGQNKVNIKKERAKSA